MGLRVKVEKDCIVFAVCVTCQKIQHSLITQVQSHILINHFDRLTWLERSQDHSDPLHQLFASQKFERFEMECGYDLDLQCFNAFW